MAEKPDEKKEPETETVAARVPNGLTARGVERKRVTDEHFANFLRGNGTYVEKVWGDVG